MKAVVVGVGHVGLPTAAALSHVGHEVVAVDSDAEKVAGLRDGNLPFFEPGLHELVEEEMGAGRLSFSDDVKDALEGAAVAFLCVGTPPRASGEANLLAFEQAAAAVAEHADGPVVLVEKSTVPAGTANRLAQVLGRSGAADLAIVSNPEFLREGRAVEDSLHPIRVLVGSDSPEALAVMRELYRPFVDAGAIWLETDVQTAELSKHASNAFLALKISFANALARVCDLAGADVVQVADAMGSDPRIGRQFLDAGLGYGGYCFPKDLAAFDHLATRLGYDFALLREVAKINDEAIDHTFHKVEEVLWNLEGKTVTLLGLSFKPGTDDTRLSPALALAKRLIDADVRVSGYDPQAGSNAKAEVPQLEVAADPYEAVAGAHCVVVCTDWPEFRDLDLTRVREAMRVPVIIDGRNLLDASTVADAGFTYIATGRPAVFPVKRR
jgi:UDPglucose 6-dehydrogenase